MSLATRKATIQTELGQEEALVVACPQRIDPVPISECARCELCHGLELDGRVSVRCAVEPADGLEGSPAASASVCTIMTAPVVSVEEDASIENVQWLLLERGIGAVPVVDRHRKPIGILAKTDLLRDRDEPTLSARPHERAPDEGSSVRAMTGLCARDVMTPIVHAVFERMSIAGAASVMAQNHVHHVVVVDAAGAVVGIVSTLDIARWVAARERFTVREI